MSYTHSTTKRRTFKHLNAHQRGQIWEHRKYFRKSPKGKNF